jgi:hypothetical protein
VPQNNPFGNTVNANSSTAPALAPSLTPAAIHATIVKESNGAFWNAERHAAMIADINASLAADPRTAGKVFVVDPTSVKSEDQINAIVDGLYKQGQSYNPTLNRDSLLEAMHKVGVAEAYSVDPDNEVANPKDLGYVAVVTTAENTETVNEAMSIYSRAVDQGANFRTKLTPEFTHTFTIAHEAGHGAAGWKDLGSPDYNRDYGERCGDATAALYWIQKGGDIEQLETLADARDLALGYRPDASETSHGLTHDTSGTLRAVIADARSGKITAETLRGRPFAELSDAAVAYADQTMPRSSIYRKQEAEQDRIRYALGQEEKLAPDKRAGIAEDFKNAALSDVGAELAQRIDAAHAKILGGNSGLDYSDRYAAPLTSDDVSSFAPLPQSPLPPEAGAPQRQTFAAWRQQPPSDYGGHDPQTQGSLGSAVDIGQKGPLTQTYQATLQADANAILSSAPPLPGQGTRPVAVSTPYQAAPALS